MKEKKLHIENDPDSPRYETGYSVPDGYFESFSERLNLRMQAEGLKSAQQQNFRTRGVLFYLKPALGLAAGLAILLSVFLYPYMGHKSTLQADMQDSAGMKSDDPADLLPSTYASLISDAQFLLALTEMDDYDASKISKEGLADYLAFNCSDFEILNDLK